MASGFGTIGMMPILVVCLFRQVKMSCSPRTIYRITLFFGNNAREVIIIGGPVAQAPRDPPMAQEDGIPAQEIPENRA